MNGVLTGETGADFIGLFAAAPDKNVTNHYITFHFKTTGIIEVGNSDD